MPETKPAIKIEARNVCKVYETPAGPVTAVDDFSLTPHGTPRVARAGEGYLVSDRLAGARCRATRPAPATMSG